MTIRHLMITATDGGSDSCAVSVGPNDGDAIEYARSTVESRAHQGFGPECTLYDVYDLDEHRAIAMLARQREDHGQSVSRTVRVASRITRER